MSLNRDLAVLRQLQLESTTAQEGLSRLIISLETSQIQAEQRRNQEEMRKQQAEASVQARSKGLDRWNLSQFVPNSVEEKVILACHCFALDSGFTCLEEMKNSTPGFAPSLREVPPARFVSDNWNTRPLSAPNTRTLMYKHTASKKRYDLSVAYEPSATDVRVTVTEKGGGKESKGFSVPAAWFAASTDTSIGTNVSPASLFDNIGGLESSFQYILSSFGYSNPSASISGSDISNGSEGVSRPVDTRVGAGDVFPQFQGPGGGMLPNPAAGNLVGPDHPLFGLPSQRDPGYPGLPQPRFDPFGPVAGSNGPNFGGNSFDPRYPRPGQEPGGPDPDHLKPPDTPDATDPNRQFHFPGGRGRGRSTNRPGGGSFGFI